MLKFSLDYTYVASRVFTFNGRHYQPGDVIDKTGVSPHRLKQMYELRKVRPLMPADTAVVDVNPPQDTDGEPESGLSPHGVASTADKLEMPQELEAPAIPAPAPIRRKRLTETASDEQ